MTQELRQQDNNQRLLALGLQASENGGALTVIAPFGLLLSQDIKIEIANVQVAAVPFRTCLPGGCIATTWLDATSMAAFAKGAEAVVVMTSTTRQQLRITISLNGFSAALNRLRAL
jgi:invasion protein IalB